jgi:hypothetical protein
MPQSEHDEQVKLINWFREHYKGVLIYATPNGANLSGTPGKKSIQWRRLESEGAMAGIPDLHIPEWDLWIEMKTIKGKLSPKQIVVIERLRKFDTVLVCYGFNDAKKQVMEFVRRMPPVAIAKAEKQIQLRTKHYGKTNQNQGQEKAEKLKRI